MTNLTQFIIDEGKAQGYTFKTVGDCLGDPRGNWYRDPATGNAISTASAKRADSASSKNLVVARAGAASAAAESTAASASASATAESGSSGLIALGKRIGLTVSLVNVAFALL